MMGFYWNVKQFNHLLSKSVSYFQIHKNYYEIVSLQRFKHLTSIVKYVDFTINLKFIILFMQVMFKSNDFTFLLF